MKQKVTINRGETIGTFVMSEEDDYCIPLPMDDSPESKSNMNETLKYVGSITSEKKQYDPQFDFSGLG